jgi:hypothetical protein
MGSGAHVDSRHCQQPRPPLQESRQASGGGRDVHASAERVMARNALVKGKGAWFALEKEAVYRIIVEGQRTRDQYEQAVENTPRCR